MKQSCILPNFVFMVGCKTAHALRDVLGDFAVLAFTHYAFATHGLAVKPIAATAENQGVKSLVLH